ELGDCVGDGVFEGNPAADQDGERDGGVEMTARDVGAGEDHDHEGSADGEGRDDARRAGGDGAAEGGEEGEGAEELCGVIAHGGGTLPGAPPEGRGGRLELRTCGLGNRRSIQLSYERKG